MFGFFRLKSQFRKLAVGLLCLLLLTAVVQCIQRIVRSKPPVVPIVYTGTRLIVPEDSPLRAVITVETVRPHMLVSELATPGTVQAIPANLVQIFTPLSGQIAVLSPKLGDVVHKGDALLTLIAPDLAQAIADKSTAEATNILAQQTLQRQRELMRYNIGPLHDLQLAEGAAVQSLAELDRARARLSALQVSPADKDPAGNLIIHSPVNGVVAALHAGMGSYWSDLNAPIMTIMDLSQVYMMAAVQEHDIAAIYLGQEVRVVLDNDGRSYVSTVALITPALDPDTRSLLVGIVLDNSDQHLRPNMFARVYFKSKPAPRIMLPLTAVIQRGFDSIVFVEVAPWQFTSRIVQVGAQVGQSIQIQSGLATGERVVLTGGIILND